LKPVSYLTNAPGVTHFVGDVLMGLENQARTVTLRHAVDGHLLARLEGHTDRVISLDTSWDGRFLATPSLDGTVRIWEIPGGKLIHTLAAQRSGNSIVQFSPDGQTLATAGTDGTVTLWSVALGRKLAVLRGPLGGLAELLFAEDGRTLAAYGGGLMTVWRADPYEAGPHLENASTVSKARSN
jgi:WD40 repeat protein